VPRRTDPGGVSPDGAADGGTAQGQQRNIATPDGYIGTPGFSDQEIFADCIALSEGANGGETEGLEVDCPAWVLPNLGAKVGKMQKEVAAAYLAA
jgi:hypothetical protein